MVSKTLGGLEPRVQAAVRRRAARGRFVLPISEPCTPSLVHYPELTIKKLSRVSGNVNRLCTAGLFGAVVAVAGLYTRERQPDSGGPQRRRRPPRVRRRSERSRLPAVGAGSE